MNPVKDKLKKGGVACGQMVLELFTPGIAPMLAASGMEFVIFDMEHGRCDISLAGEMIAFCRSVEIVPMVRVPDANVAPLSRVLDLGARGVMIPRVENRAQMVDVVAQLKYAPEGRRGVALGVAHDQYRPGGPAFFADANADVMVIALLETATAYENLDDIISVPGLDVAWMGHYDLTVSMGIPAQFDHPKFLAAMDALVDTCSRHHVAPGFLVATPEEALHWIRKGFRMVCLGTDIGVFMNAARSFRQAVNDGLQMGSPGDRGKSAA
ncbi:MAG: aldolase [Acidobacteria bacterium]|nr:aldolase [Acidobacteriota bacterium]